MYDFSSNVTPGERKQRYDAAFQHRKGPCTIHCNPNSTEAPIITRADEFQPNLLDQMPITENSPRQFQSRVFWGLPMFAWMLDAEQKDDIKFKAVDSAMVRDGALTQFVLGKTPPHGATDNERKFILGEFGLDGVGRSQHSPEPYEHKRGRIVTFRFKGGLCNMQCAMLSPLSDSLLESGVVRVSSCAWENTCFVFFTVTTTTLMPPHHHQTVEAKILVSQIINFHFEPIEIQKRYPDMVSRLCSLVDWARTGRFAPESRRMVLTTDVITERVEAARRNTLEAGIMAEAVMGGGFFKEISTMIDYEDAGPQQQQQVINNPATLLHVVAPQQQQQQQQNQHDGGDDNDPSKRSMNMFSPSFSSAARQSRIMSVSVGGSNSTSAEGSAARLTAVSKSESVVAESMARSLDGAGDGGGDTDGQLGRD